MSAASERSLRATNDAKWLVLFHHIRPQPHYLRVRIGRRLRATGAVAIKNSVYVLPAAPQSRGAFMDVSREIHRGGGRAVVCEARFIEGLSDDSVQDLFREARDRDYAAIIEEAKKLLATLEGRRKLDDVRRHRITVELERLKRRFQTIVKRDLFGARSRQTAAGLLSLAEDRLQGVEDAAKTATEIRQAPRGTTWVTRTGVMVDRIASAWLIRKFIDPEAIFKFVAGRGYRPLRGEIRFDMAGADFTHEDDRCTFETLLQRFGLQGSALQAIAEVVHDIDLKDEKFGRPETAGVDRMIVGLAIARQEDEERIAEGATIFNSLYESFRRRAR